MIDASDIERDTRPGDYYVSALDGRRAALLAGPFAHHDAALDAVDAVRLAAQEVTPLAVWWAFGTCRREPSASAPRGHLNAAVGLPK